MKIGLSVPLAHETPQQWAKKLPYSTLLMKQIL